jgi:hypothetical protein
MTASPDIVLRTTSASVPSPGDANQDLFLTGPRFALVLDGATPEPGAATGCRHSVRWLVAELAGQLGQRCLADGDHRTPVPVLLGEALTAVAASHGRTCDLENPCSPSATLALLRLRDDTAEYAVLGDSTVALGQADGTVHAVTDDRLDRLIHLPWAELRGYRNRPGGFWVAGARPEAAEHAVTGHAHLPRLTEAALLTDGATRAVERFGRSWRDLFGLLRTGGPTALIARTREYERATEPGRFPGKHHDDATAVYCRIEGAATGLPPGEAPTG